MLRRHNLLLSFISLSLAAGGCGADEPTMGSQLITAAEGGTLVTDDAELSVPAAALGEDTTVTLLVDGASGYPALEDGLDRVVVLEPAGVVLAQPASIVFAGGDVSAAATVRAHQLVDGEWAAVETATASREEDGRVRLRVGRFGVYGVTAVEPVQGEPTVRVTATLDDAPLAEARVTLWTALEQQLGETTTGADGQAVFELELEAGEYFITVERPADTCGEGFSSFTYAPGTPVSVSVGFSRAC